MPFGLFGGVQTDFRHQEMRACEWTYPITTGAALIKAQRLDLPPLLAFRAWRGRLSSMARRSRM